MTVEIFTPAELVEIEAYNGPWYVFRGVMFFLAPVLLLVAVLLTPRLYAFAGRLAAWMDSRLGEVVGLRVIRNVARLVWKGPGSAAALVFAFAYFEALVLVELPTDVYFGFVREKAFHMTSMTFGTFVVDWVKGQAVSMIAIAALTVGLFGLARRLRHWWWVLGLVAGVGLIGSALIDPYRSQLYIKQTPLEDGALRQRITALLAQEHLEFADIVVDHTSSKTVALQAYFAGTGPTRKIVLNDSLVKALTTDEAVAAVAHEMGHVHESRWLDRVGAALALLLFLGLIEWLFRRSAARGWLGVSERADVRLLPVFVLIFQVSLSLGAPISGALSRQRELDADDYALRVTGSPAVFQSMLVKATRVNKLDPNPPSWFVLKGMSHPPMAERVDRISIGR